MNKTSLNDRVSKIRDLLNGVPRRRSTLERDPRAFSMLCSAMDAIGDAELAIEAHTNLVDRPDTSNTDELYLIHFGLVASLGIQHDSIKDLCLALGSTDLASKADSTNRYSKDIRNDVIHQSNRRKGEEFWSLSRTDLTKRGFRLYGYRRDGTRTQEQWVECSQLAMTQSTTLGPILDEVISRMKKEDIDHRTKHRSESLANLFQGFDYAIETLKSSSLGSARNIQSETVHIQSLQDMATNLGVKLKHRGEYENAAEELDDALSVLARADEHCREPKNSIDFRGVTLLVEKVMTELYKYALDVDRSYSEQ